MNPLFVLAAVIEDGETRYGGSAGPDMTQYLVLVLSLLATIAFMAWGFQRLFAGTLKKKAEKRSLQVLDMLPLSNKQKVAVVRCYDRSFLLGLSDKQVELIAELDASVAKPEVEPTPDGAQQQAFLNALKKVQLEDLARRVAEKKAERRSESQRRIPVPPPAGEKTPRRVVKKKRRKKVAAPEAAAAPRVRRVVPKQVSDEFPQVGGLLA